MADRPSARAGVAGSAEPRPKPRRAEKVRGGGPHGPAEQTRRPGSGCPPPTPGCYACGDSSLSPLFIRSPAGTQLVSDSLPLLSSTRAARLRGQQFLIIRGVGRALLALRGVEGQVWFNPGRPPGQTDRSAAPCFRKPTTSSAPDWTWSATRANVVRLPSPAGTRSVSPTDLEAV